MKARLVNYLFFVLASLTALAGTGCTGSPVLVVDSPLAYPDAPGRMRSLAMDPPIIRGRQYASRRGGLAWYDTRNDMPLVTAAGYQGAVEEQTVNVTIDRQTSHAGRSRDHYSSTTYRRQTSGNYR